MMPRTLLVDLGNSRLKWAWLDTQGRPGRMRAALHAITGGSPTARGPNVNDFLPLLPRLRSGDRVLAVCVAAPVVRRCFAAAVRQLAGRTPQFVRSSAVSAGLKNGYREPWRLGADRWIALLGARPLARDLLVVDAGTAVTIDLLDAGGRHHGGCILPGLRLMSGSLLQGTGGIRRRAAIGSATRRGRAAIFARATREAVDAGALLAVVGAVERAVEEATDRLGKRPRVLITGGDAAAIAARLRSRHEIRPALVLEGLAELRRALSSTDLS